MTATEPDDPALFAVFNEIGIIEQLSRNRFERRMPLDLTVAQFSILNHFVRLGGPRSPLSLARSFQVTKGAVTSLIAKLKDKGLVTVAPDPTDGRGKLVDITPAGRSARDACIAAIAPELADLSADLDDVDWARTLDDLRRLRRLLDASR